MLIKITDSTKLEESLGIKMGKRIIGKKYIYYDKEGKALGIGKECLNGIYEIPFTCGCARIDIDEVEMWQELQEYDSYPNSDKINRIMKND